MYRKSLSTRIGSFISTLQIRRQVNMRMKLEEYPLWAKKACMCTQTCMEIWRCVCEQQRWGKMFDNGQMKEIHHCIISLTRRLGHTSLHTHSPLSVCENEYCYTIWLRLEITSLDCQPAQTQVLSPPEKSYKSHTLSTCGPTKQTKLFFINLRNMKEKHFLLRKEMFLVFILFVKQM